MLFIDGKYNRAAVMIDEIDGPTRNQIAVFVNHPAFAGMKIVIMPDCHAGIGAVVGFTAPMNDKVIPNVIGVDIGCGVDVYSLTGDEINLASLDRYIRNNIPCGAGIHKKPGSSWSGAAGFRELFYDVSATARHTGQDTDRVIRSLGTLGGGNHFIEVDQDESGYFLTIHSGSRNFGLKVAGYHQQVARESINTRYGDAHNFNQLEWLEGKAAETYLNDMAVAQRYAAFNRKLMAGIILEGFFKLDVNRNLVASSVHNYINFSDRTIRKGAIEAYEDQLLVIPFNMRDGIALGYGLGNANWNFSAPHGAGRIMSRTQAKERMAMTEYRESMSGIWTSCVSMHTLDEAPMAYKETDIILAAIKDTVRITRLLKPLYNFKAA